MLGRLRWRAVAVLAMLGAVLLLSACSSSAPQSTITTDGAQNDAIWNVYWIIFALAAVVFVLVEGLLVYTIIRFRRRPRTAHGRPVPVHGNTKLEILWTVIPAIVLVFIAVPTLRTIADLDEKPPASENPVNVTVIGHQFYWEFHYDDLGFSSTNELHVPTGRKVYLTLTSDDVIHSMWVPRLAGKTDSIPGRLNHMWIEANANGDYSGQCAEFCGLGHANMRFKVVATSEDDYSAWVDQQLHPQAGAGDPAAGEAFFVNGPCAGCHTIDGKTSGTVGPNLTHFTLLPSIAGVLDNTPENVAKWLADPPGVKPGTIMPNLHLSQQQIADLVAFLETLK